VVSLSDDSVDGERLHRVQIFEPHRLWFTRASDGALAAMLVRYEQTRYISPDSRLTMKFVTRVRHDSGRETMTTWTTHTTHLRRLGPEDAQAFRFEPPAGVPVRRAAARDDLARMLPALRALRAETADTAPVPSDAGAPERR
jgi:hypothetical protein